MNKLYFSNLAKTRNLLNSIFIALILFACATKTSFAAVIEPYDFGPLAPQVTKSWNQDVALYVAKRFAAENGLDPNDVTIKKLNAGATNHFIYLMFIDNQMKFVLKGLGSKNEAELLFALQNYPKIPEIQNNPAAATLTLSKLINSYKVSGELNSYYFAILEAAQGKELFKIMADELLQHKDINTLKEMFYRIGQQTSELHKTIIGAEHFITPRNLSSVIHDDFHPENSFFNIETNTFSLIDNESMGDSIAHPLPLIREIYGFYEVPIIRWPSEKVSIDLLKDADPHDLASIYYEFILGAASVYQDSKDAKKVYVDTIIKLNNMSIAFLTDRYSEFWMYSPSDKDESHIVWGKFSRVAEHSELARLYINKLQAINQDLKSLSGL